MLDGWQVTLVYNMIPFIPSIVCMYVSPATWRDSPTAFCSLFGLSEDGWGENSATLPSQNTYFLPEIVALGFHRAQDSL